MMGSRSPMGRGKFEGERGVPLLVYRDTLRSSVQNGRSDSDALWVVGSDGS